jgi:hypothetical protein
MERKFAFEKVDSLFMSEGYSVWESEIGNSKFRNFYGSLTCTNSLA